MINGPGYSLDLARAVVRAVVVRSCDQCDHAHAKAKGQLAVCKITCARMIIARC